MSTDTQCEIDEFLGMIPDLIREARRVAGCVLENLSDMLAGWRRAVASVAVGFAITLAGPTEAALIIQDAGIHALDTSQAISPPSVTTTGSVDDPGPPGAEIENIKRSKRVGHFRSPKRLITVAAVLEMYQTSLSTIYRRISDESLTDFRKPTDPKNAPLILDDDQAERLWSRKPIRS